MRRNLGRLAQLRRLYHHCVHGGKLQDRDISYIRDSLDYYGISTVFTGSKRSLSDVISEIEKTQT